MHSRFHSIVSALLLATPIVVHGSPAAAAATEAPADSPSTSTNESGPVREGFTMELGLGGAVTSVSLELYAVTYDQGRYSSQSYKETKSHPGLAPLSLSLGGFLSQDWALLFRASGTSFTLDDVRYVNTFSGLAAQFWPSERLMLGAGVGLGTLLATGTSSSSDDNVNRGFALSGRVGYSVLSSEAHALRFAFEATPAFYENVKVTGYAVSFEWQLL